jgi:hypothetical protein
MHQAVTDLDAPAVSDARAGPPVGTAGARSRVLVIYEEGPAGAAALREAAKRAAEGAELAVATLAPRAKTLRCCKGGGAGPYNCAVRDAAAEELVQARTLLGPLATRASFTTLVGTPEQPLPEREAWSAFDTIIVPGRRLARGGGQLARMARRASDADIRVVCRSPVHRRVQLADPGS